MTNERHGCSLFYSRLVNSVTDTWEKGSTLNQHSLDDLPDILTIHEAAEFMRISSGLAYSMARRYRATKGQEGLPVFMAGERVMRVSKLDLARYIAGATNS